MECYKCGKEMGRNDTGMTLKGIDVEVVMEVEDAATITYNNRQLGKYSNGCGGCHVAICYECYIDIMFGIGAEK